LVAVRQTVAFELAGSARPHEVLLIGAADLCSIVCWDAYGEP